MKHAMLNTVCAVTTTCLLSAVPAFADYPEGRGWQAVKSDFEDIDASLAQIGDQLDGLDDQFDGVLDAISDVSDQVTDVGDAVDMVQASLDAEVKVTIETSSAFAVEDGDGEALALLRVEQMGAGVEDLAIGDFGMISQQIAPAGCTAMGIMELQAHGPAGSYSARLVPAVAGNYWCAGTYIATLTVDTGLGTGGVLVKVDVPAATP